MGEQPRHNRRPLFETIILWLCKEELSEEIIGNLFEYRYNLRNKVPTFFGRFKFWYEVISYLRPTTLKRIVHPTNLTMFYFNPRLAIRSLWKNRTTSLINLSGFALGMMCVSILYFYITKELSYDSFHKDKEEIYRVIRVSEINGDSYNIGLTSAPFAQALLNDYPESIKSSVRVAPREALIRFGDQAFQEDKFLYADPNFFDFFSYSLKLGNAKSVFETPNSIVITEKMAQKYFQQENPLGKILTVDNETNFQVTGVIDEQPGPSHLEFDFVASIEVFKNTRFLTEWWWNSLLTYVKIDNINEAEQVKNTFPAFMDKYFGEDFIAYGNRVDLNLEPLEDIYFNYDTRYDQVLHGNKNRVSTLGIVAIAILLIACFNYLNLSLASSFNRSKEVGIRKILGSEKSRLISQFLGESFILVFSGILLAILLTEILLPTFNQVLQLDVSVNWLKSEVILFMVGLGIIAIIFSGLYPALVLSSFAPIKVLRGGKIGFGRGLLLRKGLVVIQFVISIFMIMATLLINQQLDYVANKNLGFNDEAIVLLELRTSHFRDKLDMLKERLSSDSDIISLSSMTGEPGGFHDASTIELSGTSQKPRARTLFCDYDYFSTFGIKVKAGRAFSNSFSTDLEAAAMINEAALKDLNWSLEEAIGKKVIIPMIDSVQRSIIGVVENYHFSTLKDKIEPLIIAPSLRNWKLAIKVNPKELRQGVQKIHEAWDEVIPEYPFKYEWHDENLANLYEDESKQKKVFSAFAGVSVFLACLGIFGLVSHTTVQKRKEFGIRKVLGASIAQILAIISTEFVLLISCAYIFSIPLAWLFIDQWLSSFAYKIELWNSWYIFLLAGVGAMVVALITVAIRSINTALSNPTESIRYE